MGYYSAMDRNKLWIPTTARMNLKCIMLSAQCISTEAT